MACANSCAPKFCSSIQCSQDLTASAARNGVCVVKTPIDGIMRGRALFVEKKLHQVAWTSKSVARSPAPIARAQGPMSMQPASMTSTMGGSSDDSWLELHGVNNWAGLLPSDWENLEEALKGGKINNMPDGILKSLLGVFIKILSEYTKKDLPYKKVYLDEALKNEIIKYGEMAQLTYDSVDFNPWSRNRYQNRFTKVVDGRRVPRDLFGKNLEVESNFAQLPGKGYKAVAYVYASGSAPLIESLQDRTSTQDALPSDVWIGYIAYSNLLKDIVVAWTGTLQPATWVCNGEVQLMAYTPCDRAGHKSPPSTHHWVIKAAYAFLAFVGAFGYGTLSALVIAAGLYVVLRLFESESLLGIYTGGFAAIAALPISKTLLKLETRKINQFVGAYTLAVGGLAVLANLMTTSDVFWMVNEAIFLFGVLLPASATVALEAWDAADEGPQVHKGFYELYDPSVHTWRALPKSTIGPGTSPREALPRSGKSPRRVVHDTLQELIRDHPDVRTISVTGHSVGGAMATLSAYDVVESGANTNANGDRLPVACFAFGAPRVGNPTFVKSFAENKANGLAAIRVINKPDIVTQLPKTFCFQNVYYLLAATTNNDTVVNIVNWVERLGYKLGLPSAFQHVAEAQQLVMDSRNVDYLKKMPGFNPLNNLSSIGNYHNLEVYLHLVSGYYSETFTRDFAMCNKFADVIDERAGIPPNWFANLFDHWRSIRSKVVLHDSRAELADYQDTVPLTMNSKLEGGLLALLHYPSDDDALALQELVRSGLASINLDPATYELDHAIVASSAIYLLILCKVEDCTLSRLTSAILKVSKSTPDVTYSMGWEAYALESQGEHRTLSKVPNPPIMDFVFYYASSLNQIGKSDPEEVLVVHGMNLEDREDLRLRRRAKGLGGKPHTLDQIHRDQIAEAGLSHLIEDPDSVPLVLPDLGELPTYTFYLESWVGSKPVGRRVPINVAELLRSKGGSAVDPRRWVWDVFISHSGAKKDLANTLNEGLQELGLITFFDREALEGGQRNDTDMDMAASTAPIGILLLDSTFFERKWPLRELVAIVKSGSQLPVWISTGVDKQSETEENESEKKLFERAKVLLRKRPDKVQLSEEEWAGLAAVLCDSTTAIVKGSKEFTATLVDRILYTIVLRCHNLCVELGNEKKYDSMKHQRFRDRVLRAVDAIVDGKRRTVDSGRVQKAMKWQETLRALNADMGNDQGRGRQRS